MSCQLYFLKFQKQYQKQNIQLCKICLGFAQIMFKISKKAIQKLKLKSINFPITKINYGSIKVHFFYHFYYLFNNFNSIKLVNGLSPHNS